MLGSKSQGLYWIVAGCSKLSGGDRSDKMRRRVPSHLKSIVLASSHGQDRQPRASEGRNSQDYAGMLWVPSNKDLGDPLETFRRTLNRDD